MMVTFNQLRNGMKFKVWNVKNKEQLAITLSLLTAVRELSLF